MLTSFLLTCALTAAPSEAPAEVPDSRTAAEAQVEQALEAELAGNQDRRRELLAQAQRMDPSFPPARWHDRQVFVEGQWLSLSEVERRGAASEILDRYEALRVLARRPSDHLQLAAWCAQSGLVGQGRLHLLHGAAAFQRRTDRDRMLTDKLGFDVHQDSQEVLVSREHWNEQRQSLLEQQTAFREWQPKLLKLAEGLSSSNRRTRQYAGEQLKEVRDSQAIPALESIFSAGGPDLNLAMVETVSRMPEHEASLCLARHAVYSPHEAVRNAAARHLAGRRIHDYSPWLLSQMQSPLRSRFWVQSLPDGRLLYSHDVIRQGAHADFAVRTKTRISPLPREITIRKFGSSNPRDWRKVRDTGEPDADGDFTRQLIGALVTDQIRDRQREVARQNLQAAHVNARVASVLRGTTGRQIGDDPVAWWRWWWEYNELQAPDDRQLVEYVYSTNLVYPDSSAPPRISFIPSCFPAGTLVWTLRGKKAIEQIRPGDQVLAQDADSGELAYKVVLGVTQRPPTPLLRFRCGDEQFSVTKGHPLWVVGQNWRMAKFVQPGQRLHTLSGGLPVDDVSEVPAAPAYNLIVDGFHSYFVTDLGILAHDNTLRKPTLALVPGLKEAAH